MTDAIELSLEQYIQRSWAVLLTYSEKTDVHMYLPHPFIAPSVLKRNGFAFQEQFYWDTYFTNVGLLDTGRVALAKGAVENLLYLNDLLGYVPNSSKRRHSGRSQPPLLSSMVLDIFEHTKDLHWLERTYHAIVREYNKVWVSDEYPHSRNVYKGLSRYFNADKTHRGAEKESGWDYTSRFEDRALDFLPVDLNCFLFKYEYDLSFICHALGMRTQEKEWALQAEDRKKTINELMWDEKSGLYFDYDYVNKRKGTVQSLASYAPLFVGLASEKQAKKLADNLPLFQTQHGLTITSKEAKAISGKQWTAPNGWAPLHYIVTSGLDSYGFTEQATTIRRSWVKTVEDIYQKTGLIFEKYNMIDPAQPPTSAVYPDQTGFGWTNAITAHYLKKR